MAANRTQPPDPVLDFDAASVRAAMRVLGIKKKDLEIRSRDDKEFTHVEIKPVSSGSPGNKRDKKFGPPLSEATADLRFETFERKRREMLRSIADLASKSGPDAHERHMNESVDMGSAMEEVQKREAATIEKLRKRAQEDVQKIALQELAAKQLMEETKKKQEASVKRFQEIAKVKKDALKEQQAIAAKKQEKYTAAREKADLDREKKADAIYAELLAVQEKKATVIAARDEAWHEARQKKNEESKKIDVRLKQFEKDAMQKRVDQYDHFRSKHDSHMQALQAKHVLKSGDAEALRQKIDHTIANARTRLESKEQKAREKHNVFLDHEDKVKIKRHVLHTEKWKEINAEKKKARQAFELRLESVHKAFEKRHAGNERLTRSMSDVTDFKYKQYGAQSQRIQESHAVLEDLVTCNADRISRAYHHQQLERLKKVRGIKDRMKSLDASKFDIQQRRYDAMKNCAIEKMQLQHQIDVLRDAPDRRMKQLFKELGLEVKPKEADAEEGGDKKEAGAAEAKAATA